MLKQLIFPVSLTTICVTFLLEAKAAPTAEQPSTTKTTTATSVKTPDAMTTLKKAGDNLDNSMKAVSSDVHKKIEEGQKNPTVKSMEKAGNEFDSSMQTFGKNVGKRVSGAMPAQSKSNGHAQGKINGTQLQKNASQTLQNAGKAIDKSVKKLQSK